MADRWDFDRDVYFKGEVHEEPHDDASVLDELYQAVTFQAELDRRQRKDELPILTEEDLGRVVENDHVTSFEPSVAPRAMWARRVLSCNSAERSPARSTGTDGAGYRSKLLNLGPEPAPIRRRARGRGFRLDVGDQQPSSASGR